MNPIETMKFHLNETKANAEYTANITMIKLGVYGKTRQRSQRKFNTNLTQEYIVRSIASE